MLFSTEQLDALAEVGVFRPNGLNDDRRVDMTDRPFLAIDSHHPWEIDDAIRVSYQKSGGFIVEVAIADGSQFHPDDWLAQRAISRRMSNYTRSFVRGSMLPGLVVKELELSDRSPHRALVISEKYSADTQSLGPPEIVPATVVSESLRFKEFGVNYLRHFGNQARSLPVVAFDRSFRKERQIHYASPAVLGGDADPVDFSSRLVQTYMILANMAAARWCADNNVPILYRRLSKDETVWDEEPTPKEIVRAKYTPLPGKDKNMYRYSGTETSYTHFTSPLRRAVDLINHIQVGHLIAGQEPPFSAAELTAHSSRFNIRRPSGHRRSIDIRRSPEVLDLREQPSRNLEPAESSMTK